MRNAAIEPAYVLLADLASSRRVSDRTEVGNRVEAAIASINRAHADCWRAPLVTTKGFDELSGVLIGPGPAFDIAVGVNEAVWPLRFRWSLGIGRIDYAAESVDAGAMDGTAFHAAAAGVQRAERLGLFFAIEGVGAPDHELVESAAALHALTVSRWSKALPEVVRLARSGRNQQEIAERLGVTQQAVSASLRRAGFDELVACERSIGLWLDRLAPTKRTEIDRDRGWRSSGEARGARRGR